MKKLNLRFTPLRDGKIRNITIFGAAKSGIAVAKRLRGYDIFLTEQKSSLDKKILSLLKKLGVRHELGKHSRKAIKDRDLIILSPGVPADLPILNEARNKHIPVIGEIELAYSLLKKPIIAVTGTNGKTTTTALIGQIFKDSGLKVAVAGNIGEPLINVDDSRLDYVIAEISSYQLESVRSFRPCVSIILNITPDHLTRHKTMSAYARQKAAIFRNQRNGDHLIYNMDDNMVRGISKKARCSKVPISQLSHPSYGAYLKNGHIYYKNKIICPVNDIRIKGAHNIENCLAAVAAAMICKVPVNSIKKTLKRFKGVEHRIEFVGRKKGVSFYNDSKATNPDSTIVALNALAPRHKIVLILGGRDKMTELGPLCKAVKQKVGDVVLIGEAKERFLAGLKQHGYRSIHAVNGFKDAVKTCYKLAKPGDAVLLSPACASFDMFSNYEERGKVFKKIVAAL